MIAVRSLAKSYGERQVLSDVDLDLPAGGVIGLVGANGAGKSTLLSAIARLLGGDGAEVGWVDPSTETHSRNGRKAKKGLNKRIEIRIVA